MNSEEVNEAKTWLKREMKIKLKGYDEIYVLEREILNFQMPLLGVFMENFDNGIRVVDILKDSGAEKAELLKGDVILRLNDLDVLNSKYFTYLIQQFRIGDEIMLEVDRSGDVVTKYVILGEEHFYSDSKLHTNYGGDVIRRPVPKIKRWVERIIIKVKN